MALFQYDSTVLDRFPEIVGGVIWARDLRGGPTPAPLQDAFFAEQRAVLERIGQTPLSEIPSLAAWRRVFSGFGVKPTQYRSAAEALLRRLTKHGDIPSLNALVDLGNLVSIRCACGARSGGNGTRRAVQELSWAAAALSAARACSSSASAAPCARSGRPPPRPPS